MQIQYLKLWGLEHLALGEEDLINSTGLLQKW